MKNYKEIKEKKFIHLILDCMIGAAFVLGIALVILKLFSNHPMYYSIIIFILFFLSIFGFEFYLRHLLHTKVVLKFFKITPESKNYKMLNYGTCTILICWALGYFILFVGEKDLILKKDQFLGYLIIFFLSSLAIWINYLIFCYDQIKVNTKSNYKIQLFFKMFRVCLVATASFLTIFIGFFEKEISQKGSMCLTELSYLVTILTSFTYPILDLYEYTLNIIKKDSKDNPIHKENNEHKIDSKEKDSKDNSIYKEKNDYKIDNCEKININIKLTK